MVFSVAAVAVLELVSRGLRLCSVTSVPLLSISVCLLPHHHHFLLLCLFCAQLGMGFDPYKIEEALEKYSTLERATNALLDDPNSAAAPDGPVPKPYVSHSSAGSPGQPPRVSSQGYLANAEARIGAPPARPPPPAPSPATASGANELIDLMSGFGDEPVLISDPQPPGFSLDPIIGLAAPPPGSTSAQSLPPSSLPPPSLPAPMMAGSAAPAPALPQTAALQPSAVAIGLPAAVAAQPSVSTQASAPLSIQQETALLAAKGAAMMAHPTSGLPKLNVPMKAMPTMSTLKSQLASAGATIPAGAAAMPAGAAAVPAGAAAMAVGAAAMPAGAAAMPAGAAPIMPAAVALPTAAGGSPFVNTNSVPSATSGVAGGTMPAGPGTAGAGVVGGASDLPAGWHACTDPRTGHPYWFDTNTNTSHWTKPSAHTSSTRTTSLPAFAPAPSLPTAATTAAAGPAPSMAPSNPSDALPEGWRMTIHPEYNRPCECARSRPMCSL